MTSARAMLIRWHWPPENSPGRRSPGHVGVEADRFEHGAHQARSLLALGPLPDVEGLGHDVADPPPRVERGDRVLEDHLDPDPRPTQLVAPQAGELGAVEDDRPDGGRSTCTMARPVVDLPQPDSPTSPRVSPRRDAERHPRDGLEGRGCRAGTRRAGPVPRADVVSLSGSAPPAPGRSRPSPRRGRSRPGAGPIRPPSGNQQAKRWSGSEVATRGGASRWQRSWA